VQSVQSAPPVQPAAEKTEETSPESGIRIVQVSLERIKRNPYQPRTHFSHDELEELMGSIKEHGLLQPLVVTPAGADGSYQLIAGERRFRAMSILGEKTVPVIIREATEQQQLELAIIENIQRQELNALEEATAYARLADEFGLTQEEISQKVGKSRSQVANTIRLLMLPKEIRDAVTEGKISASNARTLLALPTDEERLKLFHTLVNEGLTVRQVEDRVSVRRPGQSVKDPNLSDLEFRLRDQLHCRVEIRKNSRGAGEVRLRFTSEEELSRLAKLLGETASS
jgi:ParB family chromosome partitioning protein